MLCHSPASLLGGKGGAVSRPHQRERVRGREEDSALSRKGVKKVCAATPPPPSPLPNPSLQPHLIPPFLPRDYTLTIVND